MANPLLRAFTGLIGARRTVETVVPRRSFDDVILPPATRRTLDQALAHVTSHDLIFKRWGLGERHATGLALAFNFAGPPGTGKTICAEAIAHALGRRLLVVRYAEVESLWMGETPKNVPAVFRLAREENAVLLFDEADAIAARRSTSPDQGFLREANTVVNVLLKELESFNGVVIFATNLAANFDPAFERRIRTHVLFEMPGVDEREQIWRVQMHPDAHAAGRRRGLPRARRTLRGHRRRHPQRGPQGGDGGRRGARARRRQAIHQRHLEEGIRDVLAAKRVMRQSLFTPHAAASDDGVLQWARDVPAGAWLPLAISAVAALIAVVALVVAAVR